MLRLKNGLLLGMVAASLVIASMGGALHLAGLHW